MNPAKSVLDADDDPVEVVDARGRVLAVVAASEAHRQCLPHRAALVLFFDGQNKLLLTKRPKTSAVYPERWDLTARGHLRPGEASLDAARRLVEAQHPGQGGLPVALCQLPPTQATGFEALSVFRFRVEIAALSRDALSVSREELAALSDDFRELFAPTVIDALENGMLFGVDTGQEAGQ